MRYDSSSRESRRSRVARARRPFKTPPTLAEMARLTLFHSPLSAHPQLHTAEMAHGAGLFYSPRPGAPTYSLDYTPYSRFALTLQRVMRGFLGRRRYHRKLDYRKSAMARLGHMLRQVLGIDPNDPDSDDDWD